VGTGDEGKTGSTVEAVKQHRYSEWVAGPGFDSPGYHHKDEGFFDVLRLVENK